MTRPLISDKYEKNQNVRHLVDGCLLGDGTVDDHGSLALTSIEWEAITTLNSLLRMYGIRSEVRKKIISSPWSRGQTCFYLWTESIFIAARKRWYRGSRKIIPNDLTLSRTALLWWFIGDGSVQLTGPHKNRLCVHLHTECFYKSHQQILRSKLQDLGIQSNLVRSRKYSYLALSGRGAEYFFLAMGPCPAALVSGFGYKWRFFTGLTVKTCPICGKQFVPEWAHRKLCSNDCRAIAWGAPAYRNYRGGTYDRSY